MMKRIKEYLEYRKYKRTAIREFARMSAAALPSIRAFAEQTTELLLFLQTLTAAAKDLEGEQLVSMVLKQIADKLAADQPRLMEILRYMAGLSPEDMRKILVHSTVETLNDDEETE